MVKVNIPCQYLVLNNVYPDLLQEITTRRFSQILFENVQVDNFSNFCEKYKIAPMYMCNFKDKKLHTFTFESCIATDSSSPYQKNNGYLDDIPEDECLDIYEFVHERIVNDFDIEEIIVFRVSNLASAMIVANKINTLNYGPTHMISNVQSTPTNFQNVQFLSNPDTDKVDLAFVTLG